MIDIEVLLEKFPGKGGWVYAKVPAFTIKSLLPFGWVIVNGAVDDVEVNNFKLMPMGDGTLFFSLNAKLRNRLGKKEGDKVRIKLQEAVFPKKITKEILECFSMISDDLKVSFQSLTALEQEKILIKIYSSKTDKEKSIEINKLIDFLLAK